MALKMQPTSVIKARLGIEPNGKVHKYFTKRCRDYMDKYVPMDEGNLRTNVSLTTNTITYESPYARYQYYGVREDGTHRVQNYTTAGTGTYWDKRMVSVDMPTIVEEVQEYVNRGGKEWIIEFLS